MSACWFIPSDWWVLLWLPLLFWAAGFLCQAGGMSYSRWHLRIHNWRYMRQSRRNLRNHSADDLRESVVALTNRTNELETMVRELEAELGDGGR